MAFIDYEHWARKLSGAAIFGDACVIAKQADALAVLRA